jgi:hypothetical protein
LRSQKCPRCYRYLGIPENISGICDRCTTEIDKLRVLGIDVPASQIQFGDYSEGRWAWALKLEKVLDAPVPMKGALSIWDSTEVALDYEWF